MDLTVADAVLFAGVVTAAATDLRDRRIPNLLTGSLIGLGIVIHIILGAYWLPIVGILVAFALHFALFALQVERPGDGKLMIGVGALAGWSTMLETTLWSFILLVPVGLFILAVRGRLGNLWETLKFAVRKALRYPVAPPEEQTYMAFAPVIACATFVARFTDWLYLWGP
ncbi:MAG: prepilin peptidase [Deltaproteobacteria bacterium]|nr:prepilin peptidase [Deltaproteobacteria bacterium]